MTAASPRISRIGLLERAPETAGLTDYDRTHVLTYARLLDAERDGYDWPAVAIEVLDLDVDADRVGAEKCWRSHLDRAHWFVNGGFAA